VEVVTHADPTRRAASTETKVATAAGHAVGRVRGGRAGGGAEAVDERAEEQRLHRRGDGDGEGDAEREGDAADVLAGEQPHGAAREVEQRGGGRAGTGAGGVGQGTGGGRREARGARGHGGASEMWAGPVAPRRTGATGRTGGQRPRARARGRIDDGGRAAA
jgi:hypothetical protein